MSKIEDRITQRFRSIFESQNTFDWKDPNSSNYDRQYAEDALFHTIGPLTDSPSWVKGEWTSPSEPVPGFTPGGPAPRWTQEELIMAFAGDPGMLQTGQKGNPRSPEYGNKGGSPLYRTAFRLARIYNRVNDRHFIADLYQNGFIPLMQMMQPGYDQSRSPFISYAIRNIESVMGGGVGGNAQSIAAISGRSPQDERQAILPKDAVLNPETGEELEPAIKGNSYRGKITPLTGFKGLLKKSGGGSWQPDELRSIADNQVKGKFRTTELHDKDEGNPFGKYSPAFYSLAHELADALEMDDEREVEAVHRQIHQQIQNVRDENIPILGASTGIGQAISTADRKTSIDVGSMDAPSIGSEDEGGMAANLAAGETEEAAIDPETINYMLDLAINTDLDELIGHIPKYQEMAVKWKAKGNKIGNKMGANELRYIIRTLGRIASTYPGKGMVRAKPNIPRDARGWWEPGSDPEIEPIPGMPEGTLWHSIWKRKKYASMGPTEISQEMTKEISEFEKLGIPTVRIIRTKQKMGDVPKIDPETGEAEVDEAGEEIMVRGVVSEKQEAVSKAAVSNTLRSATIKLQFIAELERGGLGLDEPTKEKKSNPNSAPTPTTAAAAKPEEAPLTSRQRWAQGFLDKAFTPKEGKNRYSHPLLEDIAKMDPFDRELIAEACDWACAKIEQVLIPEKAPPGWKKTVEHMKSDEGMTDEEAFSRAWATYNKNGSQPDKKKKNANYAKESKMKPVDALALEEYDPNGLGE